MTLFPTRIRDDFTLDQQTLCDQWSHNMCRYAKRQMTISYAVNLHTRRLSGRLHAGPLTRRCIGHRCTWHPIRADKISWHLIFAVAVWRQVPNGPLQSDTESMKEKQKMSDRGSIARNKNLITFERQHASDEIFIGKRSINKQREKSPNATILYQMYQSISA